MTILSRSASLLVVRTSVAVVVLSLAVLGAWTAGDLLGQPSAQQKPRSEEEEDQPKKKKRVEVEEDNPQKKKEIRVPDEKENKTKSGNSRQAAPAASGDLTQLADQATHPALKSLYRSLAVPYDLVMFRSSSVSINGERRRREDKREDKVEPTKEYLGNNPGRSDQKRLQFTPLPIDGKRQDPYFVDILRVKAVHHYETTALEKVQSFLREDYDQRKSDDALFLLRYDMLTASEKVLMSVLSWHDSAIRTGKRSGKDWDKVEKELRSQLLEVRLEQMKMLAEAKDWDKVWDLTHFLAKNYGDSDERIFRPVADMIQKALKDPTSGPEQKKEAFKRLHELEMEFPNNKAFRPFSEILRERAESLRDMAKELANDKDNPEKLKRARDYLTQAEDTWPQLAGLGELRNRLGMEYPILRVGVRGPMPKYFSPSWACTDNERRAVEMLFESLVKLVPDEAGGFCYRQGLAESPPKVVRLGRQFDLPRNAHWSDGRPLSLDDIAFSWKLLRDGKGNGRSLIWGDLLDKVESNNDPFHLTLRLKQGFLDPLALMSFKVLPQGRFVDREEFAKKPLTSGPFRVDPTPQSDERRRPYLAFVANPTYGQRPTKKHTPHLREIRFYTYADNANLAEELSTYKLDLVLDLTAKQAEGLQNKQNADIVVPMPSPDLPNRRIYFLAVNTSKLNDAKLRQALSFAIDREGLLNKHFRASPKGPPIHKALCGPFPVGSWACKPINDDNQAKQSLFDPDRAKLMKPQARVGPFKLKYTVDNPAVDEAMKELCAQVKEHTGVVLEPAPCDPYRLREDVEKTNDYDLAYYHYDFPDESYWLAPLFGPPPGTKDKNMFRFKTVELTKLLEGAKSYRNFAQVQGYKRSIQDLLNREMPFIPLWQLDPLLAYRRDVVPVALDPLLVFSNIEEWQLLRK